MDILGAAAQPILASAFAKYFKDLDTADTAETWLLAPQSAIRVWETSFGPRISGFFQFPDQGWVASTIHPDWNTATDAKIANVLGDAVPWRGKVYFCVDDSLVILTTWPALLRGFRAFLMLDDDCPLVVASEGQPGQAIGFAHLGRVMLIDFEYPLIRERRAGRRRL